MRIQATQVFIGGRERFEKDDIRTVPDDKGAVFVANGWAIDLAGRVATGEAQASTDLDINNSILGLGDSNG